jgi:WD40 repeat protein
MRVRFAAAGVFLLLALSAGAEEDSDFPAPCKGFLESKHAKLAQLWGHYDWRHANPIDRVAISPDGKWVLSSDGVVRLWDVVSGKERLTWTPVPTPKGREVRATAVAFLPDGRRALVATRDSKLRLLELPGGRELRSLDLSRPADVLAVSSDGKTALAAVNGGEVHVVGLPTWELLQVLRGGDDTAATVGFSPDAKRVHAIFVGGGPMRTWDLEQGLGPPIRLVQQPFWDNRTPAAACFSEDGRLGVTRWSDSEAGILDLATGELRSRFQTSGAPLALSYDGKLLATTDASSFVVVWDVPTGRQIRRLSAGGTPTAAAFSRDSKILVVGSDKNLVRAYNLAAKVPLFDAHVGPVLALAVRDASRAAEDRDVLSAGQDTFVKVWDAGTGTVRRTLSGAGNALVGVAFAPNAKNVILGVADDRTVHSWDGTTDVVAASLPAQDSFAGLVTLTPDGKLSLVAASDPSVPKGFVLTLREVSGGTSLTSTETLKAPIGSAAISSDSRTALIGGTDGSVELWDVPRLRRTKSLPGHYQAVTATAIAPSGRRGFTGSAAGMIKIWDLTTGEEAWTIEGHTGPVVALAVSPDGALLLSASADGSVALWDLAKLKPWDKLSLESSADQPSSAIFLSERSFLVGTQRGVILRFDLKN